MDPTYTVPIYAGEFRHAVDPKGRVTVPAKWRRGETEDFYVIPDQNNQYLAIMPPEEFKAVGVRLNAREDIPESAKRIFLRNFYSQAQPTTVDRQGRMLLPEDYCKRVGIEAEVMMAGGDLRFEIWNPDRWKTTIEDKRDVYNDVADKIGF